MYNIYEVIMRDIHKLGFDVVSGCQLKCVGCPNSTLDRRVHAISLDDYKKCLANIDVDMVRLFRLFSFGEAFLHPDLPSIVDISSNQKWKVGTLEISTNAQIVDKDVLKDIFKTGVLSNLVVSCDGDGTPENYEELRPPAKWERLVEFLDEAKRLRDIYSPNTRLFTRTICVSDEGRRRWKSFLNDKGWEPEFRGWILMPDSKRLKGEVTGETGVCCWLGGNNFYVESDGAVVPCCAYPRVCVLGNLKDMKYSQIRNGSEVKNLMKLMKEERPQMEVCGRCVF